MDICKAQLRQLQGFSLKSVFEQRDKKFGFNKLTIRKFKRPIETEMDMFKTFFDLYKHFYEIQKN